MKKVGYTTGRYQLLHKGHAEYLVKYAKEYDELVIGLGSCYDYGTQSNSILAIEREKMLRKVLEYEKVDMSKIKIIHMQDYPTYDEWLDDTLEVRDKYGVTHFITGNIDDIVGTLKERNIDTGMELVNPETNSSSQIHASTIRKAVINGEYEEALEMLHPAVKDTIAETGMIEDILKAYTGEGVKFVNGRQTVDMIFFVEDTKTEEPYILCGNRSAFKKDFPGKLAIPGTAIEKFESPIDGAVRTLKKETGLELKTLNLTTEPALFMIEGMKGLGKLHFVNLYSSTDPELAGTRGGSSQVFGAYIKMDINEISKKISSSEELLDVKLIPVKEALKLKFAYQHNEMIQDALYKTGVNRILEKFQNKQKEKKMTVVNVLGGPGAGKSVLAAKMFAYLKQKGVNCEFVSEFAKDALYDGNLGQIIEDGDQLYILGQQNRRISRLPAHNVDMVVTDGSLLITAFHANNDKAVFTTAVQEYNKYDNKNLFIEKGNFEFQKDGRFETEEESKEISNKMKKMLDILKVDYTTMVSQNLGSDSIDLPPEMKRWLDDIIAEKQDEKNNEKDVNEL